MYMLKIMFTITDYGINGVSRVVNSLMNNFSKEKYEILLLSEKIDKYYYPIDENIKIINLNVISVQGYFNKIRNIVRMLANIRKNIIIEKPDIVLSSGDTNNCYVLLATLFCRRVKIIIAEHNELFFDLSIRHNFLNVKDRIAFIIYRFLIFFLYRRANHIIAASQHLADLINKVYFINCAKIKVINNPVDITKITKMFHEKVEDFQFESGVHYIGVISRLASPQKKIDHLIKSMSILKNKLNVRLVIIGDGPDMEDLVGLAKKLDLTDIIYFLGYKLNPYKYLKNIDVFVLPTDFEGFPLILVETMACRVPVVVSNIDVLKEIIDNGVNGFLVDTKNSIALSECIYNLIADKELKNRIVNQACERIKSLDLRNVLKKYENVIEEIN